MRASLSPNRTSCSVVVPRSPAEASMMRKGLADGRDRVVRTRCRVREPRLQTTASYWCERSRHRACCESRGRDDRAERGGSRLAIDSRRCDLALPGDHGERQDESARTRNLNSASARSRGVFECAALRRLERRGVLRSGHRRRSGPTCRGRLAASAWPESFGTHTTLRRFSAGA